MATNFLVGTMLVFFIAFGQFGETTRYLPMLIWDHLNDIVSCKCNWLTITKVDLYDHLTFVCPTLNLTVSLLDGQTRAKSEMNLNLFRRKWLGTLEQLKQNFSIGNNDLCDPSDPNVVKAGSCINGESLSFTEKFTGRENFKENEIYIYFNNAKTGNDKDLKSKKAICHMVFIVQVTDSSQLALDMSYGKCHLPDKNLCGSINETCTSTCNARECPDVQPTPSSSSVITSPSSSTSVFTTYHTNTEELKPTEQTSTASTTVCPEHKTVVIKNTSACVTIQEPRALKAETFDRRDFGIGIAIGVLIGGVIIIIFVLAYYKFYCRKSKCWQVTSHNGRQSAMTTETVIDNKTATPETKAGFNNQSFEPQTPSPTSSPPEEVMYMNGLKTDVPQVDTWLESTSLTRPPAKLLPPLQGLNPSHRKNKQLLPIVRRHHSDLNRLPSIEQSGLLNSKIGHEVKQMKADLHYLLRRHSEVQPT